MAMRAELVDFIFSLANSIAPSVPERKIYEATGLMLAGEITPNPYGGLKARVLRDVRNTEWPRIYDWLSRLRTDFGDVDLANAFDTGVNAILAAHGVVWEITNSGEWARALPLPLQEIINTTLAALDRPNFDSARQLFDAATDAFNARPRRDRDACSNAFDALESAAKIAKNMPTATFGSVVDRLRGEPEAMNQEIQKLLRDVELMRHKNFGHGMTQPFSLQGREVDFVYTVCTAGILLFV